MLQSTKNTDLTGLVSLIVAMKMQSFFPSYILIQYRITTWFYLAILLSYASQYISRNNGTEGQGKDDGCLSPRWGIPELTTASGGGFALQPCLFAHFYFILWISSNSSHSRQYPLTMVPVTGIFLSNLVCIFDSQATFLHCAEIYCFIQWNVCILFLTASGCYSYKGHSDSQSYKNILPKSTLVTQEVLNSCC